MPRSSGVVIVYTAAAYVAASKLPVLTVVRAVVVAVAPAAQALQRVLACCAAVTVSSQSPTAAGVLSCAIRYNVVVHVPLHCTASLYTVFCSPVYQRVAQYTHCYQGMMILLHLYLQPHTV
jgi:hypothetical protein